MHASSLFCLIGVQGATCPCVWHILLDVGFRSQPGPHNLTDGGFLQLAVALVAWLDERCCLLGCSGTAGARHMPVLLA
jgi:hypothetical protein